jgi:hypothetical protein
MEWIKMAYEHMYEAFGSVKIGHFVDSVYELEE